MVSDPLDRGGSTPQVSAGSWAASTAPTSMAVRSKAEAAGGIRSVRIFRWPEAQDVLAVARNRRGWTRQGGHEERQLGGTLAQGGMQLRGQTQTPRRPASALRLRRAPRAARTSSRTRRGARLLSTNGQRGTTRRPAPASRPASRARCVARPAVRVGSASTALRKTAAGTALRSSGPRLECFLCHAGVSPRDGGHGMLPGDGLVAARWRT